MRQIMYLDSKVHGANKGHIWGRQDPGGPNVGPMNFAIWVGNGMPSLQPLPRVIMFFVNRISRLNVSGAYN